MTEEESTALYVMVRKQADSMSETMAALEKRTASLSAAIAKLEKLPADLGQQTSQFIAGAVKKSIQDDFSRPIEEAVKEPLRSLNWTSNEARDVLAQVSREARSLTWRWLLAIFLLGVLTGAVVMYFQVDRDISSLRDQIGNLQQQLHPATAAPASQSEPRRKRAQPTAAPKPAAHSDEPTGNANPQPNPQQ